MKQVINEFCEHLMMTTNLSTTTIEGYRRCLQKVLKEIGQSVPDETAVRRYMLKLRNSNYSVSYINNIAAALEKYMAFLGRKISLPRLKRPKSVVTNVLTEGEIARMLAATKNSREKVIIAILAYTGIRNKELCNLRVKDINLEEGTLLIRNGKGSTSRVAYMTKECAAIIAEYLKDYPREEDDFLITTLQGNKQYNGGAVRKLVRIVAKRAGIDKRVYPHLFRHSLACNLLERGANLMTIQHILGHAHLQSTLIYARSTPQRIWTEYTYYAPSYL